MTDKEMEILAEGLREYIDKQGGRKEKKTRKGVFSKLIVLLCITLAVGYTGFCLLMQYKTGVQPEPQLTLSFMGFVAVELWNLSKIKREKKE